jgi:hypothetical protein
MDSRSYQADERRIEAIEKVAVFAAKLPRPVESDSSSSPIVSGTCLHFCELLGEAEPRVAAGCLRLDDCFDECLELRFEDCPAPHFEDCSEPRFEYCLFWDPFEEPIISVLWCAKRQNVVGSDE